MNDEDKVWFNGIYPYFRMLKRLNELIIILTNNNYNIELQEDYFFEFTNEFMRILPYKVSKEKNEIELQKDDGIMLLKKYFLFLEKDYDNILNNNFAILNEIIKIRNKFIHEPHNIKCVCSTWGRKTSQVIFKYKSEFFELDTDRLIKIIAALNITFGKIKDMFFEKVNELEEKDKDHPYILNVSKYDFNSYNRKYERIV